MPRLSNSDYLSVQHLLTDIWKYHRGQGFQLLSPTDQWYLHDYFRPGEALPDDELLAHRAAITKRRPSLPPCAGRALRHFVNPSGRPLRATPYGQRRIQLHALVNPKPDAEKLARVLLDVAHELGS